MPEATGDYDEYYGSGISGSGRGFYTNRLELTLEVQPNFPATISVYEDNLSTTTLLWLLFHHGCLKHLALRFLSVKELIWNKIIRIIHVDPQNHLTDIFTKSLQVESFTRLQPWVLEVSEEDIVID